MLIKFLKYLNKYFLFGLLSIIKNYFNKIISLFFLKKYNYFFETRYLKNKLCNNELNILCDKYQCDKGFLDINNRILHKNFNPHTYADFYDRIFYYRKNFVNKVFEFGIGSNNLNIPANMGKKFIPGASLRVWRDYFPNAFIYGADIDKNVLFSEERIKTFYIDQLNIKLFGILFKEVDEDEFDIIIDDGLHSFEAITNTFEGSYGKLNKNGIYIIEDVDLCILKNLSIFFLKKNINFEIVSFHSNLINLLKDSNLIIIYKKFNLTR